MLRFRENRVSFRLANLFFRPITAQLEAYSAYFTHGFSLNLLPFPCLCSDLHEIRNLSFFRRARLNRAVVFQFCWFVCLLSWAQLNSSLIWTSFFLPSFLPFSSQTNDIFVNFFPYIFKAASPYYRGKKLVEFDLDFLKVTSLSNPSLPFPCIRTIWHQFNFFNPFLFVLVCCYFIFHSGLSKRNFWCQEHCSSSKIGKVTAIWRYFYNSSADWFASNLT